MGVDLHRFVAVEYEHTVGAAIVADQTVDVGTSAAAEHQGKKERTQLHVCTLTGVDGSRPVARSGTAGRAAKLRAHGKPGAEFRRRVRRS